MSFLQPLLLVGLPLVGVPILIHLINRMRHRTLPWGAMMFLLDAKRMTRGMARLRFWLIMAMRMLAIAALLFAMARPLTSGWLGRGLGGQAETTLILLDRSASMQQQELATGRTKQSAALTQVADVLRTAGGSSRIVLIDSTDNRVHEFDSPDALLDSLNTTATATTADLPGMLQQALDDVVANETGRTDVWVCSDLRENDWSANDGRWASLRDGFQTLEGVKFYLLSYASPAGDNLAVRVANVRQQGSGGERELILDVGLTREADDTVSGPIPCEFVINGTRSVVNLEMTGDEYLLQGHQIPLDANSAGGWGKVQIPMDENPADNVCYFVFADPPVHHTTIVFENDSVAEALRIAATSPLDTSIEYTAELLPAAHANEIDFGRSSLILWQAELPDDALAAQLTRFVEGGRPVIFFPPENASERTLFDIGWDDWQQTDDDSAARVTTWRGDSDLWAHAGSGEPLGIGELQTYRWRRIRGTTGVPLARLDGGDPLLYRANVTGGTAYFCATLPLLPHSSLAQDGLAFYALIQRALSQGAATQSNARDVVAGSSQARQVDGWRPSDGASKSQLLSARWLHAGAYEAGLNEKGEQRLALNRPMTEDRARILDEAQVDGLLAGLDVQHIHQSVAGAEALTGEIWRALLACMALALIIEALLCLPDPPTDSSFGS